MLTVFLTRIIDEISNDSRSRMNHRVKFFRRYVPTYHGNIFYISLRLDLTFKEEEWEEDEEEGRKKKVKTRIEGN